MDKNVLWHQEKQIERTIANLQKHNMDGFYIPDATGLIAFLKKLIPESTTVAVGDSITLFETGVIDWLRNGPFNFLDKYHPEITSLEKKEIYRRSFSADIFLCSTNALTEEGELYNIDGNGSRVAAMLYGPEQVIIVAGINKIVKNLNEAEERVRNCAAPMDAKRLHKNTPCAVTGGCVDCNSTDRICNDFVVIKRQFVTGRIKVVIVGESLGY